MSLSSLESNMFSIGHTSAPAKVVGRKSGKRCFVAVLSGGFMRNNESGRLIISHA